MGGRGSGRIPRPAGLKIVEGRSEGRDSGGRRIPSPHKFIRAAPEPPDWLDCEAKAAWDRIVPGLERLDLIKPQDHDTLVAYCLTWSRLVHAYTRYRSEGLTLTNPGSGREHKHPAVSVAEVAAQQLYGFAREFGLTPSSEQRLASAAAGDVDGKPNPFDWGSREFG